MKLRLGALALVLGLAPACSLVRSPILTPMDAGLDTPGLDAPPPDIPGLDAPDTPIDAPIPDVPGLDAPDTPVDAGTDAPIDTGVDAPVDTGVDAPVDTGVDAPIAPIDTGVDAPTRPTCRDLFGSLGSFMDCASSATTCELFVDFSPATDDCNGACGSAGATCITSYRASGSCTRGSERACDNPSDQRICVCSRP